MEYFEINIVGLCLKFLVLYLQFVLLLWFQCWKKFMQHGHTYMLSCVISKVLTALSFSSVCFKMKIHIFVINISFHFYRKKMYILLHSLK